MLVKSTRFIPTLASATFTFPAKVGIKSCSISIVLAMMSANYVAITWISYCWQVHGFILFPYFLLRQSIPTSFFKFIIF